jgi:hypothetical protein
LNSSPEPCNATTGIDSNNAAMKLLALDGFCRGIDVRDADEKVLPNERGSELVVEVLRHSAPPFTRRTTTGSDEYNTRSTSNVARENDRQPDKMT